MPTSAEHVAQAQANEAFHHRLLQLGGDASSLSWAVVVLFYAAVHYGRAFVTKKTGQAITSHKAFQAIFARAGATAVQYAQYRALQTASERARYDCAGFTAADVEAIYRQHYVPLRDSLLPLI